MDSSILNDIKKILNVPADYDVFDPEIIIHINSVFLTLNQLGIGPAAGFFIEDDEATWGDYLLTGDINLNAVKTYIYLRVRVLFDPPTTSFVLDSMNQQIKELEWRLNVQVDPGNATTETV